MRLEDIAIALRPRTSMEAIDLGYAMVQQWWRDVLAAWCAVYLPVALLVNLLCWKMPVLAVVILWWLKPAFDRVVLHVLASSTFGEVPTLRQTLRALPRLWWRNSLFAALSYARFNLARSFTLPVTQLEGSRGNIRRQRRRILGREGWGAAVWLTLLSMHFEFILIISCYFLADLFMPQAPNVRATWDSIFNAQVSTLALFVGNALNALVVCVLEPFYVAAGFAIYLNCRSAIEGWDVELAFKRLAARLGSPKGKIAVGAARLAAGWLLGFALALTLVEAPDLRAQEAPAAKANAPAAGAFDDGDDDGEVDAPTAPSPSTPHTGAKDKARQVLAAPEFGHYETERYLHYIGPTLGERDPPRRTKMPMLEALIKILAESARLIAWIVVAIVVVILLYLLARYVGISGWRRVGRRAAPDMLFGLDVRPESLPDDLPAAVRALLARGEIRAAAGLLYRGALVSLLQEGRIEIGRGDTEGECLRRVTAAYRADAGEQGKAAYFNALVLLWQRVAYARLVTDASEVERLVDGWPQHFAFDREVQAGDVSPVGQAA